VIGDPTFGGGLVAGNGAVQGRTVTSKAMTILDAFAGNRTELSLSDITRATGLPSSTVHRLAQELVTWGGLERTPQGRYAVGLRLWEIAARSGRSYGLRDAAMPFLQVLFDLTRENVQLAVLDGHDALLVEKITGSRAVATLGRVGGRLPLHASAVGKALLAWAPDEVREEVLASPLPAYTTRTITTGSVLRGELAEIRLRGYALSREEVSIGADSCAAPIMGPRVGLAAISVVVPAGGRQLRGLEPAVIAAARGIVAALEVNRPPRAISAPLTGTVTGGFQRTIPTATPSGVRPR
jgi:DNA-binding IclR family transcriptional regulator